jgi:osmotically-inducible protein OsmY
MQSDAEIKRNVEDELRWDPDIDTTDIGITVKDSVVTLAGFVRSYSQKRQAEEDAKRVAGVVGVANDIEVRLPILNRRPDPEIARDVVATLKRELPYASEHFKVTVQQGVVTLDGSVEWRYQRDRAVSAARRISGVRNIVNQIVVMPKLPPTEIKRKIEDAFRRNAEIDASNIEVVTDGSSVTLRGTVRSWAEREEAERVAWTAPGVARVDNRITVKS